MSPRLWWRSARQARRAIPPARVRAEWLELAQMIRSAAEHQVQLILAERLTTAEARIGALEGDLFLLVADLATQIQWHDAGATPPPPRITPAARKIVAKHRTT